MAYFNLWYKSTSYVRPQDWQTVLKVYTIWSISKLAGVIITTAKRTTNMECGDLERESRIQHANRMTIPISVHNKMVWKTRLLHFCRSFPTFPRLEIMRFYGFSYLYGITPDNPTPLQQDYNIIHGQQKHFVMSYLPREGFAGPVHGIWMVCLKYEVSSVHCLLARMSEAANESRSKTAKTMGIMNMGQAKYWGTDETIWWVWNPQQTI